MDQSKLNSLTTPGNIINVIINFVSLFFFLFCFSIRNENIYRKACSSPLSPLYGPEISAFSHAKYVFSFFYFL